MIAMLQNGLDVRGVITHRFPVAEFEAGFAAMRGGSSGKVVLDWGLGTPRTTSKRQDLFGRGMTMRAKINPLIIKK